MKKTFLIITEVVTVLVVLAVLVIIAVVISRKTTAHAVQVNYNSDFAEIQSQFDQIHQKINRPIGQITGNWCTACSFVDKQPESSQTAALATNSSSWRSLWFASPPKDPYGNDYTLDENEQESGPHDCRPDVIISAGPDGILFTADDVIYKVNDTSCQGK